jgi:hypothetical protein
MPLIFRQLTAVLDDRTTVICLHAAGQIVGVKQPFDTLAGTFMNPPFHVHCRSIAVPWVPGFVNEQRRLSNAELQRRPLAQRDTRNFDNRIPGPDGGEPGVVPPSSVAPEIPEPVDYLERKAATDAVPLTDVETLPSTQRAGVASYMEDGYGSINRALRRTGPVDDQIQSWIGDIDRLMGDSSVEANVVVWRGISAAGDVLSELKVGDVLIDDAFMSTSFDRGIAEDFVGSRSARPDQSMLLRILVGNGSRARSLYSPESDELEMLIDRGSGLRVTAIEVVSTEQGGRVTMVTCVLEQAG